MKIQLTVSEKYYKEIEKRLLKAEFEIDENGPFLLSEKEQFASVLLLKDDELELYVVKNGERLFDLNVDLPETVYDAEVNAQKEDDVLIVLRGIDAYELDHRKVLTAFGDHVEDWYFEGGDSIFDADGTLLVGVEIPY